MENNNEKQISLAEASNIIFGEMMDATPQMVEEVDRQMMNGASNLNFNIFDIDH